MKILPHRHPDNIIYLFLSTAPVSLWYVAHCIFCVISLLYSTFDCFFFLSPSHNSLNSFFLPSIFFIPIHYILPLILFVPIHYILPPIFFVLSIISFLPSLLCTYPLYPSSHLLCPIHYILPPIFFVLSIISFLPSLLCTYPLYPSSHLL
jgi:hypothetical protein